VTESQFIDVPDAFHAKHASSGPRDGLSDKPSSNTVATAAERGRSRREVKPEDAQLKALDNEPAPDRLRRIATENYASQALARQADAEFSNLLAKYDLYVEACARWGRRSALLISGVDWPSSSNRLLWEEPLKMWPEAIDAMSALNSYIASFRTVVDPEELRARIAAHFNGRGFCVKLIRDPYQRTVVVWFAQWLLPRNTLRVTW
jgi:hypothetical protein